jgi:hypothetical protein
MADNVESSFQLVNQRMTEVPILAPLDFMKLFEINYDAYRLGIERVLS